MSVGARPSPAGIGGPFYEDLGVGQRFEWAPAVTLTDGHAAVHQAILGDRLPMMLDAELCRQVTGRQERVAHPALVCDVAIGLSTLVTHRVVANLFYRGLALRRAPVIGDTLRTTTEVVALRDNTPRRGRAPTGLVGLRIHTVDQAGRDVLDFHRCAMLPMRGEHARPGHADDLAAIGAELPEDVTGLAAPIAGWDLAAHRARYRVSGYEELVPGESYRVDGGDTVSAAPELARLTANIASAHHDPAAGLQGRRLVYGGHTIGLALSQLTRALPGLVTVLAWRSCDHTGPVFEGDVLRSRVEVGRVTPLPRAGALVELRVLSDAERPDGAPQPVLDWRLIAVFH